MMASHWSPEFIDNVHLKGWLSNIDKQLEAEGQTAGY